MNKALKAISFEGITPDTLGGYLMGLGLLNASTELNPAIYGCWRDDAFNLLAESTSREEIESYLLERWRAPVYPVDPATKNKNTPKIVWAKEQQSDTKKKTSDGIRRLRAQMSLDEAMFLDSHLVSLARNTFNPIFGTGGNVGKRNLAKVSKDAYVLLERNRSSKGAWLKHTLYGHETELPELASTGTWFTYANKTFNSGQDGFYREGRISPWSFLLALEGALLLQGGVGRRLSATAHAYAAFPFIAEAVHPALESQVGLKQAGEFWAPIWDRPATLIEVRTLFKRGLMRLGKKAATSPHEFGAAALGAGLDTGIAAFVPFTLRETTSGQVFEAIPRPRVSVRHDARGQRAAELIAELVPWIEHLPFEPRDGKQKGKFAGLRGPVEQAIVALTEDSENPGLWRELLLTLADTQTKIDQDRTRKWRARCTPLPRLSIAWLEYLWPQKRPDEIELACAIASLGADSDEPLLVNLYGVDIRFNKPSYPKAYPARALWHDGDLLALLGEIAQRRLADWDSKHDKARPWPLRANYPVSSLLLEKFLAGALDDNEIRRWVPALSLLNWRKRPAAQGQYTGQPPKGGLLLLDGLFRPLFAEGLPWSERKDVKPDPKTALRLLSLIRQGDLTSALDLAVGRYNALGITVVNPGLVTFNADPERLAAALLVPVRRTDVQDARSQWILHSTYTDEGDNHG